MTASDWHAAALRGEFGPIHDSDPQPGFYRRKRRDGAWAPVAIWRLDDGGIVASVNGKTVNPEDVWSFCCRHPITEELYWHVIDGAPWPDAPPENGARSNLPDDPFEALRVEIEGELAEIERAISAGPVADETAAARFANWSNRLAELEKRAVAMRAEQVRPHQDAANAARERFRSLVDAAENGKRRLKEALAPYLAERKRELEAVRQAAIARGEQPARTNGKAAAGTVGRRVALQTRAAAVIEDPLALATWLIQSGNTDLRAELQRIGDRMARAGATAPGMRVERIEHVA